MKKKKDNWEINIEFTKESGEVILNELFSNQQAADKHFDTLEKVKSPSTYKGLTLNLGSHTGGTIGWVRLVVTSPKGERSISRELFRNA